MLNQQRTLLCILAVFLLGLVAYQALAHPALPQLSQIQTVPVAVPSPMAAVQHQPESSGFFTLPQRRVGESVVEGDYGIQVLSAQVDTVAGELVLNLVITNTSSSPIDLDFGVQLHDQESKLVRVLDSSKGPASLANNQHISSTWRFPLPAVSKQAMTSKLSHYRLVFAPKGWSGPVIVFRITP